MWLVNYKVCKISWNLIIDFNDIISYEIYNKEGNTKPFTGKKISDKKVMIQNTLKLLPLFHLMLKNEKKCTYTYLYFLNKIQHGKYWNQFIF